MNSPFFSVIIPTYNRADRLKVALDSLVAQTYKLFEVIVCDDGSTDNTRDIANCYRENLQLKYIWEENWGGPARPRNNGIKEAKGDWICFLDSDDWWYPSKLEEIVKFTFDVDLIYHDLDIYRGGKKSLRKMKGRLMKENITKELLIYGNAIPNSSVSVRKCLIEQNGFFSEERELIAVEDSEYWIRLSLLSNKFLYIPMSLGVYFIGINISFSESQINKEFKLIESFKSLLSEKEYRNAVNYKFFRVARIYHNIGLFGLSMRFYLQSINIKSLSIFVKSCVLLVLCFFRIKI